MNYDKKANLKSQGYNQHGRVNQKFLPETVSWKLHLRFGRWRWKCTSTIILSAGIMRRNFEALVESFRSIMHRFVCLTCSATLLLILEMENEWKRTKTLDFNSYLLIFLILQLQPQSQMHDAKNNESRKNFLFSFLTSSMSLHFTVKCT